VYKKTIFEINNDYKKNLPSPTKETHQKFELINEYIKIYKIVLFKILKNDYVKEEADEKSENLNKFNKLCNKLNNLKISVSELNVLELFIDILDSKINNIEVFFEIIMLYIKKINKNIHVIKKHKEKFYTSEFELYLMDSTPEKFVSWLLC
jgi:hypothetical protein